MERLLISVSEILVFKRLLRNYFWERLFLLWMVERDIVLNVYFWVSGELALILLTCHPCTRSMVRFSPTSSFSLHLSLPDFSRVTESTSPEAQISFWEGFIIRSFE